MLSQVYNSQAADAATIAPGDDADMGASDQTADADQSDWQTITTIQCHNGSGEYRLIQGDEPEEGEAPEGGEGAAPAQGDEDQGQTYGSIGELLKGVMETVKSFEATKGGEGSEAENFASGLSGGGAKAAPSQAGGM